MTPVRLDEAERARTKLREQLRGAGGVQGIGIAVLPGGYGVKVNLRDAGARGAVPDEVDGVPVIVAITGNVIGI